jgi:hypothetical protein
VRPDSPLSEDGADKYNYNLDPLANGVLLDNAPCSSLYVGTPYCTGMILTSLMIARTR